MIRIFNMFGNLTRILSLLVLPVLFSFLIYFQINLIFRPIDEFDSNNGIAEEKGITIKKHRSNSRNRISTNSTVFYLKLENNDTMYSYFLRDKEKLLKLAESINVKDVVKIRHGGHDKRQNTIDIIQLEVNGEVVLPGSRYDRTNYILLTVFTIFLILSICIPYKMMGPKEKKKNLH